jgi:hypothetical protein
MGVFNFVDDGTIPGHAVLKLSDGRKRSMSLWVEFITASGYLSARKIRSRFQALVSQTVEKAPFQESCKIIADSSDVKVLIYGKYTVQFTCAFRCNGIWPRSVNQWPGPLWPNPEVVKDIQLEGFDLVSKEITPSTSPYSSQQQQQLSGGGGKSPNLSGQLTPTGTSSSQQSIGGIPMQTTTNTMESDAWAISMEGAERNLFSHPVRAKALKIVKTLRDRHLDYEESTTTNHLLKTLVLWEFEKHPNDHEWQDFCLGDRIIGMHSPSLRFFNSTKCTCTRNIHTTHQLSTVQKVPTLFSATTGFAKR